MLDNVELWWNYGWNYMKFHPNSTHNSTTYKYLIICALTTTRWKGGITNDKNYFSEKGREKVLTIVKKVHFNGRSPDKFWLEDSTSPFIISIELNPCSFNLRVFSECGFIGLTQMLRLWVGTVFQTDFLYMVISPRLRPGLLSLRSVLSSRQHCTIYISR